MNRSDSTAELSAALAKAQAAMKAAVYNRQNPHFKNRYADLASVLDAVRKPLADNALSITQTTEIRDGAFVLVTTLWHGGQWVSAEYPLPLNAKPQELGSALTYARRYSLSSLLCIAADEDDDAEATRKAGNGSVSDTVTKEQQWEITTLLTQTNSDADKFLEWVGAPSIEAISAAKFPGILAMFEAKAIKAAKK